MRIALRNCARISNPKSEIRNPKSNGFTLIELLVAMAIIVLLMGLVLAFYPKREVRYAAQGADQLQTYIASAKARALRDQAPRGIRLIQSPQGGFREFQYIEQPEPYTAPVPMAILRLTPNVANFFGINLNGIIQVGDLLEISHGVGSIHRVIGGNFGSGQVFLASNVPAASNSNLVLTQNYRFIRQPRPLLGETILHLPQYVYVQPDNGSYAWPSSLNIPKSWDNANFDILFSPSGQVINARGGRIVLVVMDDNNVSKPTLLTVYSYTGAVGAHPQGPPGQEYSFTQDGQGSGQ